MAAGQTEPSSLFGTVPENEWNDDNGDDGNGDASGVDTGFVY